jgi:hypothetical protein
VRGARVVFVLPVSGAAIDQFSPERLAITTLFDELVAAGGVCELAPHGGGNHDVAESVFAAYLLEQPGAAGFAAEYFVVADGLQENDSGQKHSCLVGRGQPFGDVFEDVGVLALGVVEAGCVDESDPLAVKLEIGDSDVLGAWNGLLVEELLRSM